MGVEGAVRRTPRGELTVNADAMVILSKCLQPPPEKFHGLADPEVRLRKRVMDISTNADLRAGLQSRCRIVSAVRRAFEDRGYLEVETPMLHTIPGGANARPFVTHHNVLDIPLYLRIAPELHLKKLIVARSPTGCSKSGGAFATRACRSSTTLNSRPSRRIWLWAIAPT